MNISPTSDMAENNSTHASPGWRQLLRNPVQFMAFGCGAGLSPKAPGTAGTIVAIPVYLLLHDLPFPLWLSLLAVMTMAGIWLCGRAARELGVPDHPGIVWDEIAGFLITMSAVTFSWGNLLLGFSLFRLFDIAKPWPISYLDRHVKGGLGIMLDDIVAGICAGAVLWFMNHFL
jgi:phosphatidylglycerophosphatase A